MTPASQQLIPLVAELAAALGLRAPDPAAVASAIQEVLTQGPERMQRWKGARRPTDLVGPTEPTKTAPVAAPMPLAPAAVPKAPLPRYDTGATEDEELEPGADERGSHRATDAESPKHTAQEHRTLVHSLHGEIISHLRGANNLTASAKVKFERAAHWVWQIMPPRAIHRVANYLTGYSFHSSTQDLTEVLYRKYPEAKETLKATRIAGANVKGFLYLDGDDSDRDLIHHIYAHEFTHVIDGPGFVLSKSRAWNEAWEQELIEGHLTRYAATSALEGFAEFGRLLYSGGKTSLQIESLFPRCARFFKRKGLWQPQV